MELFLNLVVRLANPKTMKLKRCIGLQEVIVMIHCGASQNFISTNLIKKLELPLTPTNGYGVFMGIVLSVKGEGICEGVMLSLLIIMVVKDFLPLKLGNSNVILHMQ